MDAVVRNGHLLVGVGDGKPNVTGAGLGGGGVGGVRQGEVGECERLYAEVRKCGVEGEMEDENDEANDDARDEIGPKEYPTAAA